MSHFIRNYVFLVVAFAAMYAAYTLLYEDDFLLKKERRADTVASALMFSAFVSAGSLPKEPVSTLSRGIAAMHAILATIVRMVYMFMLAA